MVSSECEVWSRKAVEGVAGQTEPSGWRRGEAVEDYKFRMWPGGNLEKGEYLGKVLSCDMRVGDVF